MSIIFNKEFVNDELLIGTILPGKYFKLRASFADTSSCTSKSDAYSYFIAATPKLIIKKRLDLRVCLNQNATFKD